MQNRNLITVKNPALTTHYTNTELTWNCAKFQIFFSISLNSYYYYNYSAHSNIINSDTLECSNPSCFRISISSQTQIRGFPAAALYWWFSHVIMHFQIAFFLCLMQQKKQF